MLILPQFTNTMAKTEPVPASPQKEALPTLQVMSEDLRVATSTLLETTGVMYSFMQSLQSSGFREYIDYMGRPWYTFWINFILGVARGLGFVIGATVVVALVAWVISQVLSQLPGTIGEFFKFLQQALSQQSAQNLTSSEFFSSFGKAFDTFKTSIIQGGMTPPPPTP